MSTSRDFGHLDVLVVDDDPDARATLVALLTTFGVEPRQADGGIAAMRLVLRRPPDLILSDLHMQGGNGFELMRWLRRDPRFTRMLIFAVSWLDQPIHLRMTHATGFDGHITKPVRPERLERVLNRAIGRPHRRVQA